EERGRAEEGTRQHSRHNSRQTSVQSSVIGHQYGPHPVPAPTLVAGALGTAQRLLVSLDVGCGGCRGCGQSVSCGAHTERRAGRAGETEGGGRETREAKRRADAETEGPRQLEWGWGRIRIRGRSCSRVWGSLSGGAVRQDARLPQLAPGLVSESGQDPVQTHSAAVGEQGGGGAGRRGGIPRTHARREHVCDA
ncbi:hypothetical protein B484DRAFT_415831, partial [Ochromonadaceae sp. CCMP2298]